MSRSDLISAFVFLLLVAALLSMQGGLLILAIPLILYLSWGMLSFPEESHLEISRSIHPERANPGDLVTVKVAVQNHGRSLTEAVIDDVLPDGVTMRSGSSRHLFNLPKGGTVGFEYVLSALRGTYHFKETRVELGDALGLTHRVKLLPVPGQLFIVPNIPRLKHIAIRPRRTRVYTGNIPARAGGSGTEFFSVRNYQPGDPPRSINWRASARHGDFYSNEFQQERAADVGIILDARLQSNLFAGKRSMLDHSIIAVAALADAFLMQGNRVGMAVQESMLRWTFPAYGKVQRERIMQELTHVHLEEAQTFSGLPRLSFSLFPPRSQIVLVSPLITDPLIADDLDVLIQWRARGYQVMAIIPDSATFELAGLPPTDETRLAGRIVSLERRAALRRLLHAGIQVVEWDVAKPFDRAVTPYLSRIPLGGMIERTP